MGRRETRDITWRLAKESERKSMWTVNWEGKVRTQLIIPARVVFWMLACWYFNKAP